MNFFVKKITAAFLSFAFLFVLFVPALSGAANLTALSDTMSRLEDSGGGDIKSDHAIEMTTPTGVTSGQTIVVTFPSDFDGSNDGDGALDFSDVDLKEDTTPDGVCDGTDETLVASGATTSQWNAAFSGTENRVLTFTSGGGSAVIAAASEICILIGENATGGSGNSQYINPSSTGTKVITVAAGADSGSISIVIIDDDTVNITATVDQTISFSISDTAIGFGTLAVGTGRWATGDATGGNASGTTPTAAHTMAVATNAGSGYTITYRGATLTAGSNTIDAAAGIDEDSDGTPGTEQFALSFSTDGNATIASGYQRDSAADFSFVAGTTTTVVSETVATATETISASYLANISTTTEAGSYSTDITYVATANF